MKKSIAIVALISASVASSANANGFSPWSAKLNRSSVQSASDRTQNPVEIRSFYRANELPIGEVTGEPQVDVQIVPWYAVDKV